ncbi:MAG: hypothetical protein EA362_13925 [Saprospirales bacterium]|nr:MAG: hypothetical protein EA362_13925 [Saprospirales bacterium]
MIKSLKIRIALSLAMLISGTFLWGQDIETMREADPFKISGSIGASVTQGSNKGLNGEALPLMYTVHGNINMEVYSIAIPISFAFSHGQLAYTLPFNRYGMSPRYKWIRLHLGYRNMSFNPYTLAGRTFYGAGLELTPGKLRFAAMYGRLQDARPFTPDLLEGYRFVRPTYSRRGYAVKMGIGDHSNFIDLSLFKGWDDANSIPNVPDSLQIFPEENLAFGLSFRKSLFGNFSVSFDGAASAFSRDIRKEEIDEEILNKFSFLFTSRYSSRVATAMNASLDYTQGRFFTGLRYQRIDPYYQTMGAHYNLGDIENYTLNMSMNILSGTTTLSGSIGFERNDLLKLRLSSTERIIGSVGIQYQSQEGNSLGLGYHNYTTSTGQFDPDFFSDTLRINHQMHTFYVTPGIRWGALESVTNFINLNLNYNRVDDNSPLTKEFGNTEMYSISGNYSRTYVPSSLTINTGLQYHKIISFSGDNQRIGMSAGLGKRFPESGINTNFSTTYFRTFGTIKSTYYLSSRIGGSIRVGEKHSLNMSLTYFNRPAPRSFEQERTSDYRLTAGYHFNF